MKRKLLFLTFLFLASVSNAQWFEQTSGSTHWMNSLQFIDQNTGWICGYNGSDNMLIHTTDGGTTWIPQNMPVTDFLGEITFLNATTGWAVGVNGILRKSTDGGNTWVPLTIATTKALQSVFFTDENNGWIVGESGVIFHSTDGGATWNPQTSPTANRLIRVRFLNSQVGWAAGWAGTILYTADAGATWTIQTSPTLFDLISISIIDENNVWISGNLGGGGKGSNNSLWDNGAILHTSNAGATWEQQHISTQYMNAVSFADLNNGWCFGSGGMIMHTTDGGNTWQQQISGSTSHFTIGQVTDVMHGWATGENGIIIATVNGGTMVGVNEKDLKKGVTITNEPNPFSENTKISYTVSDLSKVEICIFDLYGKKITTLVNEQVPAGTYEMNWDASSISAGIYFCTMKTGETTTTRKMILR